MSRFKKKFDAEAAALKASKNKKSKWYGMDPAEIQAVWASDSTRAIDLGNWYHNQREADITAIGTIEKNGVTVPVFKPIYDGDIKLSPHQQLVEGIYPEHFVYLESIGVCGQSDRVEVVNGIVDIIDYKTNKEIKKEGFKNWEGVSEKLLPPLSHLDDCNYNHYSLQLSLYMYIILKHNPNLRPGKLILHHITFKESGDKDKYGNKILLKDYNGDPIVDQIIPYELPYLRAEIQSMLKFGKEDGKNI